MSDDLFTLEKLKVNERLQNLEIQVSRLVSHIESEQGTFMRIEKRQTEITERIMKVIDRHEDLLVGDGKPGLITHVDRLNIAEGSRTWHLRVIWAAIVGILVPLIWNVVWHFKDVR